MSDINRNIEVISAMCNWVSDVFYYEPTTEKLEFVAKNISIWPDVDAEETVFKIQESVEFDGFDLIRDDFYKLFVGPGKKEVYPWGSIYTDKENLLFGDTTIAWEDFCTHNGIEIPLKCNEPTDHFAMIFSAISAVLTSSHNQEVKSILVKNICNIHFSPWGKCLLNLINEKSTTNYYKCFSLLALKLMEKLEKL